MSKTKLSQTQIRMLRAIRDHGNYQKGLSGRSEFGASEGTLNSLRRRGLVSGYVLTPAGEEAAK